MGDVYGKLRQVLGQPAVLYNLFIFNNFFVFIEFLHASFISVTLQCFLEVIIYIIVFIHKHISAKVG